MCNEAFKRRTGLGYTLGQVLLVLTNVSNFMNTCSYIAQLIFNDSSITKILYSTCTSRQVLLCKRLLYTVAIQYTISLGTC